MLVTSLTLMHQAQDYLDQLAHVGDEIPGATLELNRKAVLLISGPLPKTAALGWGLTPATVGSYCPGPTRLFLCPEKTVPSGGGCACNCPSGVSSYLKVADTDLGLQTQTWGFRHRHGQSPFANAANMPTGSLLSGLNVMHVVYAFKLAAAKHYRLQDVVMLHELAASMTQSDSKHDTCFAC